MAGVFRFKQFSVDQSGCAMKINTDGVLLGALAGEGQPSTILDIGTGTGVIALMLAQRFTSAQIDAVEIDSNAAETAQLNFEASPFKDRLTAYHQDFNTFFTLHPEKRYDLIISNPPFYIDSLLSPQKEKNIAKHAGRDFFNGLMEIMFKQLTVGGQCWLVLPVNTASWVKNIAIGFGLYLQKIVKIKSFEDLEPHREIVVFGMEVGDVLTSSFIIYSSIGKYSTAYNQLLQPFFITL